MIAGLVVEAGHGGTRFFHAVSDADADGPVVQHLAHFVGRSARIAGTDTGTLEPFGNASQAASALADATFAWITNGQVDIASVILRALAV